MTKWILAAGAAALAIVTPALAEKGGNQGDKGKGGQSAKAERGGGGGGKADSRKSGGGERANKSERQSERRFVQRDDRGKREMKVDRSDGNDRNDQRGNRVVNVDTNRFVPRWNENGLVRGFHNGCPPGLAKKNNGCLPPGQAKKVGTLFPARLSNNMLDGAYRQWYRDDNNFFYRNDGDHIYRVRRDGGLIDALFPSLDRDYYYYPIGANYPSDYNYYNVPSQYSSFYPDGGDYSYRYGDGAIYQVNRSSGLIQGISALLAGDLSVGQRMPSNYGAYNLPMSYRDRYYDTGQDMYRYNDGYIYRADPTTQLITAVISAIV